MRADHEDCGMYVKKISDILQKKANSFHEQDNLTGMQAHVLGELHWSEEGVRSLKELEARFHVAQPTIVGIVLRLEKKGLVEKVEDASDRRVKRIRLTEEGRAHCLRVQENIERTEVWLLSRLDEGERAEFQRLLRKVYETIQ
ncbi:MAG: MarR family transcriptional regulator [Clostridia bacterium]|nr:MarR family transcriptional regulator [Clostridia bacterium]